ncbi:SO2930 family diheme c-type cytochrome [soil metagenome]
MSRKSPTDRFPGRRIAAIGSLILAVIACSDPAPGTALDASVEKSPPPAPDAGDGGIEGPMRLSETGLYLDLPSRTPAADVREYDVRYPLWADGAEKKRFLYLPPGTKIDTTSMDDWALPLGTKAWKQFTRDGVVVETRLMWKKPEGWFEMAYVWLADGTDAIAAPLGQKNARGTTHDVPPQIQCRGCHDNVADRLIGVSAIQLSNGGAGLLSKLASEGRLTKAPAAELEIPGNPIERAALGYLHGNCGHCHNDASQLDEQTKMRLRVLTTELTPQEAGPFRTGVGLKMVHEIPPDVLDVLVPGDAMKSGLYVRAIRRDGYGMPPIGTKAIDPDGAAKIRAWIEATGDAGTVSDGGASDTGAD